MKIGRMYTGPGSVDDDPSKRFLRISVDVVPADAVRAILAFPDVRKSAIYDAGFIVKSSTGDPERSGTDISVPVVAAGKCTDFADLLYALADKEAVSL